MTDMEMAMIRALASIDAELDLPQDGYNSPERTLSAIRDLKELARRGVSLACAVMTDNDQIRAD